MSQVDPLLSPIRDDDPCGSNLRYEAADMTLAMLKEYSTSVSAEVAESAEEAREANWPGVVSLCTSALTEKSKDLELVTHLAAGWVHTEGPVGLERSIELLRRMIETYWARIHPGYDDEDDEIAYGIRAKWLNWMNAPTGFIDAIRFSPPHPHR